ncbi:hypothetical protein [Qipengyuania marisflavi]|uniref:Uncharacterized protein n=1 Tax=Qipengyuania marisflavi TaxID=2486356 RepID=A0A5S3P5V0_9SPHN|nr:hypothetical protein [Qipengyuania marisflavi]TMM48407.1 hypothetical protein FEV51_09040 [Qipengyuania marisflavi]
MNDPIRVEAPGGFAPLIALGQEDAAGICAAVGPANPLPTFAARPQSPAPLSGQAAAPQVAGPFTPAPFAPVYLRLSGAWEGSVRLLRSTDGGATKFPVTIGGAQWGVFAANACEPVWEDSEAGAELYLELTPQSGTISYRVSQ